jgi:hypothetical protein
MKKRLNIMFFSICFLAALLAETYCIQVMEGDLFSVVGIGIVVLISGYLLMDSIRSKLANSSENVKYYVDRIYSEEAEKSTERYTEQVNIQKATYTATKKNTAMLSEQFEEVVSRLEALEMNNAKSFQMLIDLQLKALEGQKNALNLEIKYNKENTNQLMKALREEGNRFDLKEELSKILSCLEENNSLLKNQEISVGTRNNETKDQNFYEELDTVDQIDAEDLEENTSETSWDEPLWSEGFKLDEIPVEESSLELPSWSEHPQAQDEIAATETPTVVPLYDDPNKALTADEIAALFASFGQ